jgi:hypothetical protein
MTRTKRIALTIVLKIALWSGTPVMAFAGAHRPATLGRRVGRPTQFPGPVLIPIDTNHDLCGRDAPYRFPSLAELALDHTQIHLAPVKPRWVEPPRNAQFTAGYDWRQYEENESK